MQLRAFKAGAAACGRAGVGAPEQAHPLVELCASATRRSLCSVGLSLGVADTAFEGFSFSAFEELALAIKSTMWRASNFAVSQVNVCQFAAYWTIGRMIVVYEQEGANRSEYGDKTLFKLSKNLTSELG